MKAARLAPVSSCTCNYQYLSCLMFFFFSFFLSLTLNLELCLLTHCRCRGLLLQFIILGGTPLGEGSAQRRDQYVTTHRTHKKETSLPPAEF
jgi:hypothetical protein